MFDLFSSSHLLILLVVLLVVVGPKDLPRMMHTVGKWVGKARDLANEFKKSFDDMARQEELLKLRAEIEEMRKASFEVPSVNDIEAAAAPAEPEPRAGELQVNEAVAPESSIPSAVPHAPEPVVTSAAAIEPPPP